PLYRGYLLKEQLRALYTTDARAHAPALLDACALPRRWPSPSACSRSPQALRPARARLPHPRGRRGTARSARPRQLERPARRRPALQPSPSSPSGSDTRTPPPPTTVGVRIVRGPLHSPELVIAPPMESCA